MRQLFAGYPDIGELRRNEKEKISRFAAPSLVALLLLWRSAERYYCCVFLTARCTKKENSDFCCLEDF